MIWQQFLLSGGHKAGKNGLSLLIEIYTLSYSMASWASGVEAGFSMI